MEILFRGIYSFTKCLPPAVIQEQHITFPFLQVFTRKLVYGTDMIPESLENSGFPAIATD